MTKRSYVEAVLAGLGDSTVAGQRPMLVKLLLSIDRRETAEAAMETVCVGGGWLACVDLLIRV